MPDDIFAAYEHARGATVAPADLGLADIAAETTLLAALLTQPGSLEHVPSGFAPDHYSDTRHGEIHRAIVGLGGCRGASTLNAVQAALRGSEAVLDGYVRQVAMQPPADGPDDIATACNVISDLWRRRRLLTVADQLRQEAARGGPEESSRTLIARTMGDLETLDAGQQDVGGVTALLDAVDRAIATAEVRWAAGGLPGISTGFASIDDATGGLEPGAFYVLAGRPGMGKTALGLQIGLNIARAGVPCLYASYEMQDEQLARRALALESGVPLGKLRSGDWDMLDGEAIVRARTRLGLPLAIDDKGGVTAAMLSVRARAMHRRGALGVLIVDHLHLVEHSEMARRQGETSGVTEVSRTLKRIAQQLKVPVLALAQLSRGPEGREDKRPNLGDLRQSGAIEQDAEVVMLLYRAEYYYPKSPPDTGPRDTAEKRQQAIDDYYRQRERIIGKAELILPKVRDGEPCTVQLRFDGAHTRFSDLTDGDAA